MFLFGGTSQSKNDITDNGNSVIGSKIAELTQHHGNTDTFSNPPAPEDVGHPSTIPQREKNTPAEHLHDWPNWRHENATQSAADVKDARAKDHFERDMQGYEVMNNNVGTTVDRINEGRDPGEGGDWHADRGLSFVEPQKVTNAKKGEA